MYITKTLEVEHHTKTTILLSLSRVFEKASYYGVRSLLLMYMINGCLNLSTENSIAIYGYFAGSIIFSQLLGSIFGDLIFGNKKAIIIGGLLQAIGTFILCIPNLYVFYIGIGLMSLGSGLFNPNLTARFGKHYLNKKSLLDSGYSILYLAIAIGAMLGPFLAAISNYTFGFILSGILMLVSVSLHFFINEIENTDHYNSNVHVKQNLTNFLITISGVYLFWVVLEIMQTKLFEIGSGNTNLNSSSGLNFLGTLNGLFALLFGIGACFAWSYYNVSRLNKLLLCFIIALVLLVALYFFTQIGFNDSISCAIIAIIICLAEIIITPILTSTLVTYINTKYLTIFIGLSSLPFMFIKYIPMDSSYSYYIGFGLIVIWLMVYFIFKFKPNSNNIQ